MAASPTLWKPRPLTLVCTAHIGTLHLHKMTDKTACLANQAAHNLLDFWQDYTQNATPASLAKVATAEPAQYAVIELDKRALEQADYDTLLNLKQRWYSAFTPLIAESIRRFGQPNYTGNYLTCNLHFDAHIADCKKILVRKNISDDPEKIISTSFWRLWDTEIAQFALLHNMGITAVDVNPNR
jgi:hypothetical protein